MKTVADLIERNEFCYPDRDAIVHGTRRVTYAQYARRSRQLGSALHRIGVRQQDRVGIFSTNNIEYFEAYGACEWSGFILALYNFRSAAPEVVHLLTDSAPSVVLFEAGFTELIDGVRNRFPDITWVCVGGDAPDWALAYEALIRKGDPAGPPFRATPEHYVYLFYTSGTTGKPKGVPWDHAGVLISTQETGRNQGHDVCWLQISPAFHVGGKFFMMGTMWMGGTSVLMSSFDPEIFLGIVEAERITHTFMVPMMMQTVMAHPQFSKERVKSLRSVMAASTAIPVPLLKQAIEAFGPVFFVAYGSTESGNVGELPKHELNPYGDEQTIKRLGSVGHLVPESGAVLLDDDGNICPPGKVGEVCVPPRYFRQYWNNSVATIEALRFGYFHTGDLGIMDDQGYLYLVDRKKDMIISGGENIYSREVEDALSTNPAVQSVAVVGKPNEKWGEVVKAFVVLKPGHSTNEHTLIAHCQTQIARFKAPKEIEFLDTMPLLGTGKIDKVSLRKRGSA